MSMVDGAEASRPSLVSDAARELYEAELALHDAHTSGVDTWISAAADHLHRAVQNYLAQLPGAAQAAAA
jgi:hypothetical protein